MTKSHTRANKASWEYKRCETMILPPLRHGETGHCSRFEGQWNYPQRSGTRPPPGVCTDADLLQVYQGQHVTVDRGFRWIKNPAAISPVWLEKPERIAALAMLTGGGLLVDAGIQRQGGPVC